MRDLDAVRLVLADPDLYLTGRPGRLSPASEFAASFSPHALPSPFLRELLELYPGLADRPEDLLAWVYDSLRTSMKTGPIPGIMAIRGRIYAR